MLKYDTLGAKLLKCTGVQVGVKSAKVGLPARQTAKVADKRLISGLSTLSDKPRISRVLAVFAKKGLSSVGRAKLLKLALPGGGGEQIC